MPFDPSGATEPGAAPRSRGRVWLGLRRGVRRKCPSCGLGALFRGYLSVKPVCAVCGNDNEQYPSDDFAPYVTIFLVLHLMVPVLIIADKVLAPSVWIEALIALPVFLAATLALLPFAKGGVIGFAWAFDVVRQEPSSP
jgi:uncharacterized protein (DUF983 family)